MGGGAPPRPAGCAYSASSYPLAGINGRGKGHGARKGKGREKRVEGSG